jgi:hypothetical protein
VKLRDSYQLKTRKPQEMESLNCVIHLKKIYSFNDKTICMKDKLRAETKRMTQSFILVHLLTRVTYSPLTPESLYIKITKITVAQTPNPILPAQDTTDPKTSLFKILLIFKTPLLKI